MEKRGSGVKILLWSILIVIVLILGVAAYAYFFIINPSVKQPVLEKPALLNETNQQGQLIKINETHVSYVLNQLGFYNVHKAPGSSELPEIETSITDLNKAFTSNVQKNRISTFLGEAYNPDIRVVTEQEAIVDLVFSDNPSVEVKEFYDQGRIRIEVLKDQKSLGLKGYLSVYNELNS